ncbi:MAG: hypothetical protein Tsb009_35540 [Planctomycetaceae bacterium]
MNKVPHRSGMNGLGNLADDKWQDRTAIQNWYHSLNEVSGVCLTRNVCKMES